MEHKQLIDKALECGFTLAAPLSVDTINLSEEVREMCAVNKCHAYNTNWSCPPACGTVDECRERIKEYDTGLIVQTTGILEDDFDIDTMTETAAKHSKSFTAFLKLLRREYPQFDVMPLGAGACVTCEKCTYPDEPCRFPELKSSPMEGYGMVISSVCKANGVPYNHGRGTLTYVGCYLFKERN